MSFPRQTRPGPQVSSLLSTSGRPQQSPAARLGGPSVLVCTRARGSQSLQERLRGPAAVFPGSLAQEMLS